MEETMGSSRPLPANCKPGRYQLESQTPGEIWIVGGAVARIVNSFAPLQGFPAFGAIPFVVTCQGAYALRTKRAKNRRLRHAQIQADSIVAFGDGDSNRQT